MLKIALLFGLVAQTAFAGYLNGTSTRHLPPEKRYIGVMSQVVKFGEFMSNELDQVYAEIAPILGPNDQDWVEDYNQKTKTYKAMGDDYLTKASELVSGQVTANAFLQEELTKNLKCHLYSLSSISKAKEIDDLRSLTVTDPLVKEYIDSFFDPQDQKWQRMTKYIIDTYQSRVLFIKKLFETLDYDELSPETIQLLRASVSLWPILKGETKGLGFPDDGGGWSKLKAYIEDHVHNLIPLSNVKMAGEGPSSEKKKALILYSAIERMSKGEPSPTWEKRKYSIDAEIYNAHFIQRELEIPFLGLGLGPVEKRKAWHGIKMITTPYLGGLWSEELPDPDFLKPPRLQDRPSVILAEPSFFDVFPFEKLDEPTIEVMPTVITTQPSVIALAPTDLTEKPGSIEKEPSIESKVELHKFKTFKEVKPVATKTKEFTFASGIRKFHDLMPTSKYKVRVLSRKQQGLVDDIFDFRKINTINYGKFKSLWLSLGGKIEEDHGTSHKLLIGPEGDSLFGIYAHGDSQPYYPKTIKYIQTALWFIGCRPGE